MIKVNNIKAPLGYSESDLIGIVSHNLKINANNIKHISLIKKSIDSRNKNDIKYVLSLAVKLNDEDKFLRSHKSCDKYKFPISSIEELLDGTKANFKKRPVVIGSGPCGMFCALTLALAGAKPIVIERGKSVENRIVDVERFWKEGLLNINCNVQFGEGGAGTFSDGKLNTGIGGDKISVVLNEFVNSGAPVNILWDAKPHIGTDILSECVRNIRNKIIDLGGEYHFESTFKNFKTKNDKLSSIVIDTLNGENEIQTDCAIVAVGHSSRDTFEMLKDKVKMEQKAFSIGVRIEHLQSEINKAQYGKTILELGASDYKLATHLSNGRSCYTFCMCPGGYVVPSTSEENAVVTNGMSYHKRDGNNANSALLVGVGPKDFKSDDILAGVKFQRLYEGKAYKVSNSYKAPTQLVGDLLNNKESINYKSVKPTYALGNAYCDLRSCLPNYVVDSLKEAIKIFDNKVKGFANEDAILTGVESRSSSPVRILRDENGDSSVYGLMPAGEGAGYAGGITSACVDGINVALKALKKM